MLTLGSLFGCKPEKAMTVVRWHLLASSCRDILPQSECVLVFTVPATCQKRNDSAVGQSAAPQWTRCRLGPTAFPSLIARWRTPRRVVASPKLPACLHLRPSGAARP